MGVRLRAGGRVVCFSELRSLTVRLGGLKCTCSGRRLGGLSSGCRTRVRLRLAGCCRFVNAMYAYPSSAVMPANSEERKRVDKGFCFRSGSIEYSFGCGSNNFSARTVSRLVRVSRWVRFDRPGRLL